MGPDTNIVHLNKFKNSYLADVFSFGLEKNIFGKT
jgi:hypothetical protein